MSAHPLAAVIFDMDGTLFDSSGVVPQAFIAAVRELGGPEYQSADIIEKYPMGPPRVILTALLGRACREGDLKTYYRQLGQRAHGLIVYPGIRECLAALLDAKIRLAVFTGASLRGCVTLLNAAGLVSSFQALVGGDEVARPKPSPDGILLACARLHVPATTAAYVGDSPLDTEAAHRASVMAISAGWGHQFSPQIRADSTLYQPRDLLPVVVGSAQ